MGKPTKKQTIKKAAKHRTYQSVPFDKIGKLYTEGKSIEQIARATDRWNEKAPDPSKSLRAVISNMIRKGYRNESGKLIRLRKRTRTKAEPKPAKKVAIKPEAKKKDVKEPKRLEKRPVQQQSKPKPSQQQKTTTEGKQNDSIKSESEPKEVEAVGQALKT